MFFVEKINVYNFRVEKLHRAVRTCTDARRVAVVNRCWLLLALRQCIARLVAAWLLMASVVAAGSLCEIVDVATASRERLAFLCARVGYLALEAFGHVDHIRERVDVRRAIADDLARELRHTAANDECLEHVGFERSTEVTVLRHLA